MKKITRYILIMVFSLICVGSILVGSLGLKETNALEVKEMATLYLDGNGSINNPYLINNVNNLYNFRDYVNAGNGMSGKYLKLTCNLDLNGQDFAPINGFKGCLDGDWHTISNLYVTESKNAGLFSHIENANILNLKLKNPTIVKASWNAGALVGVAKNSIIKFVFIDSGTILGGTVGGYGAGGVVGMAINSTISYCTNSSSVTVKPGGYFSFAGGIVGMVGELTGMASNVIELKDDYSNISRCSNSGTINVDTYTTWNSAGGGIVGASAVKITNCYNTGIIEVLDKKNVYLGGIVGYGQQTVISCYSKGYIDSVADMKNQSDSYVISKGFLGIGRKTLDISCKYPQKLMCSGINGNVDVGVTNCYAYATSAEDEFEISLSGSGISKSVSFTVWNSQIVQTGELESNHNFSTKYQRNVENGYTCQCEFYINNKKGEKVYSKTYKIPDFNMNYNTSTSFNGQLPSGFSNTIWICSNTINGGDPTFGYKYWEFYVEK